MKVLVVSNLYPPTVIGGYELSCAQVVEELRRRGHDVRVLTSVPDRVVDGPEYVTRTMRHPDSFSPERPHARSQFWEIEANLLDSGNVYALVSALKAFQPDICYLWNLIGLGGAALVGALQYLDVPWVWHLGDAVPAYLCIFDGRILPIAREMSRRLTGRFVAVSQGLVNEIEHVVTLGDRVRLVPNWVLDETEPLERSYFSGGTLRVAFAGQLAEHKGVHILVDAAARLRDDGYDVTLDLFGNGNRGELMRRITLAGVADVVRVSGWLSQAELRRRYRTYDLFAFPTWQREPFAIAPLEAAAEGCVPLLSAPSGLSEWLIDGVDCLKAPRDAAAFAEVIGRACRGEIDLAPIGRRASAVVRRDFVLSRVAPILEEELRAAAGRDRHPTGDEDSVYKMALIAEAMVRSAVHRGAVTNGGTHERSHG